jgi:hypothetical protein
MMELKQIDHHRHVVVALWSYWSSYSIVIVIQRNVYKKVVALIVTVGPKQVIFGVRTIIGRCRSAQKRRWILICIAIVTASHQ